MRVNCAGRLRQGAFAQSFALLGPLLIIRAHILGRSLGRKGKEGRGWQTNQGKSTMPQLALDLPQSSEPCDLSQRFGGVSLLARLLVRHVGENAFAQAHRLIEEHRDVGGVVEAARTMPAARLPMSIRKCPSRQKVPSQPMRETTDAATLSARSARFWPT